MDKKPTHRSTSCGNINGLVLLASAGCRLFGELKHRETVYVLCGGKGTAPGCALHGSPKVPSVLFRPNAMSYVSWLQGQKGRILSPLQLGTAGMILFEQTSNTTWNTLQEVRHRFFDSLSPAVHVWVALLSLTLCPLCLLLLLLLSLLAPLLQLFGAPFAPVGTYLLAPLCPASPSLVFDI